MCWSSPTKLNWLNGTGTRRVTPSTLLSLGLELTEVIPAFLSVGNRIPTSPISLFVTPYEVRIFETFLLEFYLWCAVP